MLLLYARHLDLFWKWFGYKVKYVKGLKERVAGGRFNRHSGLVTL